MVYSRNRHGGRIRQSNHSGFTLMELVLVAAILGILAAVTIPSFVRSIRGNRLRTAARTVIMAGRYARSMAIMSQKEQGVTFDMTGGRVTISPFSPSAPSLPVDSSAAPESPTPADPVEASAPGEAVGRDPSFPASSREGTLSRRLDGVRIEWVNIGGGEEEPQKEGRCTVVYQSNGRCLPYELKIVDEQGASVLVRVDMFSAAQMDFET